MVNLFVILGMQHGMKMDILARLSRVLEAGHTSGADGLLGFGAAFCCLL